MLFIAAGILAALSVLFPFACRLFPPLAQGWLQTVFAPLSDVLSTLASPCPFPLAEPLLLLLAAMLLFLLFRARRSACLLLSFLLAGYALMWAPADSLPARYAVGGNVDAAALAAVCEVLTGRLNTCEGFALPAGLSAQALEAARLADTPIPVHAAPKPARYPEWMRALSLAGLYVPWTAEAIYDPTAPAAAQPFTAVHELMHMGGVADEGQANIYAYIACQRYGGAFARSADLWALKYAMEALHAVDADAWSYCLSALTGAARGAFFNIGGGSPVTVADGDGAVEAFLRLGGIAAQTSNYGALAAWLAAHIV